MIDPEILKLISNNTPKGNKLISDGIAYHQLKKTEKHVDLIVKCAKVNFPPELEYVGYSLCTPEEEFQRSTNVRVDGKFLKSSKRNQDISRNDTYLIKLHFKYMGEELPPQHLALPIVGRGGILHIKGKRRTIMPVLADNDFSMPSIGEIFIPLNKMRIKFNRILHHFVANGKSISANVVWSWIHNKAKKSKGSKSRSSVIYSSLSHYLFSKYGFTNTMSDFAGADVVVGTDDINPSKYPPNAWVICTSTCIAPPIFTKKDPLSLSQEYISSNIRVAIRKDEFNVKAKALLASFFYIVDHFPEQLTSDRVDSTYWWKLTLGYVINEPGTGTGTLINEINSHLEQIENYIDELVLIMLKKGGRPSMNIYEMFMCVIEMMHNSDTFNVDVISSMYNKYLKVDEYVLSDIRNAINTFMYDITALRKKSQDRPIDAKAIVDRLNKYIKQNEIQRIVSPTHSEVGTLHCSTDNLYIGVTSNMITQDKYMTRGNKGGTTINLHDESKHLHVSIAEIGFCAGMTKADPTSRSKLNFFADISLEGKILRRKEHEELLNRTQEMISK